MPLWLQSNCLKLRAGVEPTQAGLESTLREPSTPVAATTFLQPIQCAQRPVHTTTHPPLKTAKLTWDRTTPGCGASSEGGSERYVAGFCQRGSDEWGVSARWVGGEGYQMSKG